MGQAPLVGHHRHEDVGVHSHVRAVVLSKSTRRPPAGKTRAILPLAAVLQVLDATLAMRVDALVDRCCPLGGELYVGARPLTSCMDIAFTEKLLMEKSADRRGCGAIATGDIAGTAAACTAR